MIVTLRPIVHTDSANILRWRQRPDVAEHMYTDHQITWSEHDQWINSVLWANEGRHWMIEVDGRGVGVSNLANIDHANRQCDWGTYLGEPDARGLGAGLAADYLLFNHVFDGLGLNKLWCEIIDNSESLHRMRLSEGFLEEGYLVGHVLKGGQPLNVRRLAMFAIRWHAHRPQVLGRLMAKGVMPGALITIKQRAA